MRAFAIIERRHLATLWVGQLTSALGDQLYVVAIMWMGVGLVGSAAGLLGTANALAILCFGVVGGVYADRFDRRKTMIAVDVARGFVVLALPLLATQGPLGFAPLMTVAIVGGALTSFFVPALHASLPALTKSADELHATNALMDATMRLSRALGPTLAALLAGRLATIHLFTLDALSFAVSAVTLGAIGKGFAWRAAHGAHGAHGARGVLRDAAEAVTIVRSDAMLTWAFAVAALVNLAGGFVFVVGAPLFAARVLGGDLGAYGAIAAAFGVGNVASTLLVGALRLGKHSLLAFVGRIILGVGFLGFAFAPNLPIAMAAVALAAMGGPMADLALVGSIQTRVEPRHLGRVFGLRMILDNGAYALGLALAAPLFVHVSIRGGIALGAGLMLAVGTLGYARFRK